MNHKRISTLGITFILAMIAILVASVPAAAQAKRIYFTGEDCPVYMGPPERQWISEDGVLHQRGVPMTTTLSYDTDMFNGTNYIVANMEVDLATNAVHVYGKVEIHPDVGEGTWVGHFSTHVSPEGVVDGKAVAHGTGDFEGMTTFNTISSPEVIRPECFGKNTASNGYILVPNP